MITTYYNNPFVQGKALQFKTDSEKRPYDFQVEMLRDKGRYCVTAAAVTGNYSFIVAAGELFAKAIEVAEEETSKGLSRMELGIIANDWADIWIGYREAYYLSLVRGNLDRARWSARTYFGESLKRGKIFEVLRAFLDLAEVRKQPVKILADCVVGVYRSVDLFSKPINRIKQKTLPRGFESGELEILSKH